MRRHWTPGGGQRLKWKLGRLVNRLSCWRFGHGPFNSTSHVPSVGLSAAGIHRVLDVTCNHCGALMYRMYGRRGKPWSLTP